MILINDEQQLLNLDCMAIYLMLTPEELTKYSEKLNSLTCNKSVTKGLFRLDAVEKGDTPCEKLPQRMKKVTSFCNVMVRLVNGIHGIYCYGFDYIDLDASQDEIVGDMKGIVDEICNEDINRLDVLENRSSNVSRKEMEVYRMKQFVRGVLMVAQKGGDVEAAKAEAAHTSMQNATESVDSTDSLDIARGTIDNKRNRRLLMEFNERKRPATKPEISVNLTRVTTGGKPRKDNTEKTGWGFDIVINGDHLPVYFGSTDQSFFYAALFFANIEGIALKRRNFQSTAATTDRDWLNRKYSVFSFPTDFNDWYEKVQDGEAHRIDDAVSKVKRGLWDILNANGMTDAYYYLCIVTENPRKSNARYKIRITNKQIKLDPELEKRLAFGKIKS
jgi:uncharacterized protein YdeI (YjbR/CyaY-like superfamily)